MLQSETRQAPTPTSRVVPVCQGRLLTEPSCRIAVSFVYPDPSFPSTLSPLTLAWVPGSPGLVEVL